MSNARQRSVVPLGTHDEQPVRDVTVTRMPSVTCETCGARIYFRPPAQDGAGVLAGHVERDHPPAR